MTSSLQRNVVSFPNLEDASVASESNGSMLTVGPHRGANAIRDGKYKTNYGESLQERGGETER